MLDQRVGPLLYTFITNVCWAEGLPLKHCTFVQCWASVADVSLTLKQRWVRVLLE